MNEGVALDYGHLSFVLKEKRVMIRVEDGLLRVTHEQVSELVIGTVLGFELHRNGVLRLLHVLLTCSLSLLLEQSLIIYLIDPLS